MDNRNDLIPNDDIDFERELQKNEEKARRDSETLEAERIKREKDERERYERELRDKKIELMKLKQGVIETSDTVKEIKEEKPKLSFSQWLQNVWYRSKWIILFSVFVVFVLGYIIYDSVTRIEPDLTVLAVSAKQDMYYRTAELESFFEEYTEDLNGDGEVHVLIYNILTDYSDLVTSTSSQAQLMSQLQSGENIIIISDVDNDFAVHDFTGEISGDFVTDKGIKFNCELTREKLKWQAMPEELYLSMREPAKLLSSSLENMQARFDEAKPTFLKIYEDIKKSNP